MDRGLKMTTPLRAIPTGPIGTQLLDEATLGETGILKKLIYKIHFQCNMLQFHFYSIIVLLQEYDTFVGSFCDGLLN